MLAVGQFTLHFWAIYFTRKLIWPFVLVLWLVHQTLITTLPKNRTKNKDVSAALFVSSSTGVRDIFDKCSGGVLEVFDKCSRDIREKFEKWSTGVREVFDRCSRSVRDSRGAYSLLFDYPNRIIAYSKNSVISCRLHEDQLQGIAWRLREGAITRKPLVSPKQYLDVTSWPILKLKKHNKNNNEAESWWKPLAFDVKLTSIPTLVYSNL